MNLSHSARLTEEADREVRHPIAIFPECDLNFVGEVDQLGELGDVRHSARICGKLGGYVDRCCGQNRNQDSRKNQKSNAEAEVSQRGLHVRLRRHGGCLRNNVTLMTRQAVSVIKIAHISCTDGLKPSSPGTLASIDDRHPRTV